MLLEIDKVQNLEEQGRQEIRKDTNQVDGHAWLDESDPLTAAEKTLLDVRLAAYEGDTDAGSSWEEVETRIQSRLKGKTID